ncbi:MAG: hypothetical protein N7Q72_07250, partial [Spiroplasma sp. Tabriz.8]|nr:hypothetical protein [Spiroplasma sp. Tabriz.8]
MEIILKFELINASNWYFANIYIYIYIYIYIGFCSLISKKKNDESVSDSKELHDLWRVKKFFYESKG